MDRWLLSTSTLFAVIGGALGMVSVRRGRRSLWTVVWMVGVFALQFTFLGLRGKQHGTCPLIGYGEILVFLSWALTLFYLLVGSTYRISLLGVFTAPAVALFQSIALLPGVLEEVPKKIENGNFWHEIHSSTCVLAYGALALAAVAGVMFLVLDRQLKEQHLKSGLFRNLPPVRTLLISLERLMRVGGALLTLGIIAGFLMPRGDHRVLAHLLAALAVWSGYVLLTIIKLTRGLTGRRLSLAVVILFILSLGVFAFV